MSEVERLREELDRLKRGCQGSCYACEPVGEMNLKLEAEVAKLRNLLENMTQSRDTMIEDRNLLDNEVAMLRELLENVIDVLRTQAPLHYTIARMAYEKINPEDRKCMDEPM